MDTGILKRRDFLSLIAASLCANTAYSQARGDYDKPEIVIDLDNKLNISGNIQLAYAWGERLVPPRNLARGLINLKEAMNKYTKIHTELDEHLLLGTDRLQRMPFIFISSNKAFELTETERKNLRKYFENGGFAFLDNPDPRPEFSEGGASLKQLIRETIPHATFAPLLNDHPLFHVFFDFNDGAPNGAEIGSYGNDNQFRSEQVFYLEGAWHKDRLAAVYSDKGYIVRWNDDSNNEPQLKMGVNLIVYALAQEGGMLKKKFL